MKRKQVYCVLVFKYAKIKNNVWENLKMEKTELMYCECSCVLTKCWCFFFPMNKNIY